MAEATIQDLCLVERILQKRVDADTGAVEYLIRWQGTDAQGNEYDDTWEPEHNILGDELIDEFERRQAPKRPQRQRSPGRPKGSWRESAEIGQESTQRGQMPLQYGGSAESAPQSTGTRQPLPLAPPQPGMPHTYDQHALLPPPPGYFHPPQYPPHYGHPHYPASHQPYNTRTKRKLPSASNNERETARSAAEANNLSSTVNQESTSMEGVKRQKEGDSLRSQIQSDKYVERRKTNSNGSAPATMRLLKLHFDNEKDYFRSIIEKSTLVKDAAIRDEMVRFLKDPKYPGLADGAQLLESETWLIELKEQKGSSGSLFLALDIPRGEVKALFIPEWMLEHQRKARPGQGIVMKDRTVVSAIMEGDLHGSGLFPPSAIEAEESRYSSTGASLASTEVEGSQESTMTVHLEPTETEASQQSSITIAEAVTEAEKPQRSPTPVSLFATESTNVKGQSSQGTEQEQERVPLPPSPGFFKHKTETDGDVTMKKVSADSVQVPLLHCEWKNCQQTRVSLDELSKHVLQDHLQGLLASSSLSITTSPVNVEAAASALAEGSSWQARYELSQATYRSLQDQIARTKDLASKMDQKIQESRILYTSAVAKSRENIKRLEAHLEWEMKKWNKYQEQKNLMAARMVDPDSNTEIQRKSDTNVDASEPQAESNAKRAGSVLPDIESIKLDKPMEAQSINNIRDIQRTLAAAKEDLARLEEDNLALFEKRRALDTELKTLDEQFQRTVTQLAELKAKEHTTREEIKSRSQSIEDCKATMEQEQAKTRQVVNHLQSVIETMRQSGQQRAPADGHDAISPSMTNAPSPLSPSVKAQLSMSTPTLMPTTAPILSPGTLISQQSNSAQELHATDPTPNITSNFIDLLTTKVIGAGSESENKS
ncbi:hypothetical protein BGX27_008910 [Mortierella sp. AM989]|nr:hypothetical protein BGX27_008910 [Mortierella sp. AM989]